MPLASVAVYRQVLTRPGVLRLLGFAVLGRIPTAASGVVLTLFVVGTGRGYAAAGLVAAASTIGTAIGQPWRGRVVDRAGLRRALLPSILVEGATWASMPFLGSSLGYGALLAVAFAGGLLAVPIFTVVRQSLAVLVPLPQQRTAYALDSIGTELTFMAGPAIGVLLSTQWSETGAVVAVGVTIALAGVGLVILNPPTRTEPAATESGTTEPGTTESGTAEPGTAESRSTGSGSAGVGEEALVRPPFLLRDPALVAVLGTTAGALMVLAGTDVSIVAHTRADGQVGLTWVVFVAWSLSSLAGALVVGAVRRVVPVSWLLLGLGVLTVPVGFAPGVWWLTLFVFGAGLLCAPTITATATAVSRLVPEARRGEAMGWYGSAMTLGVAAGVPAAGAVIDASGAWAGFALVGGVGVAVALIGLLLIPWATDRPSSDEPGAPSGVSPTRHHGREEKIDLDPLIENDRLNRV